MFLLYRTFSFDFNLVFIILYMYSSLLFYERMIHMGHHKKNSKSGLFGKLLASGLVLAGAKKIFDNKDQILNRLKEEEKKETSKKE